MTRRKPPLWCDVDLGPYPDAFLLDVFLDGQPCEYVRAYDCNAGTVTRAVLTPEGGLVVDQDLGEFRYETIHGSVEARWTNGEAERAFDGPPRFKGRERWDGCLM